MAFCSKSYWGFIQKRAFHSSLITGIIWRPADDEFTYKKKDSDIEKKKNPDNNKQRFNVVTVIGNGRNRIVAGTPKEVCDPEPEFDDIDYDPNNIDYKSDWKKKQLGDVLKENLKSNSTDDFVYFLSEKEKGKQ